MTPARIRRASAVGRISPRRSGAVRARHPESGVTLIEMMVVLVIIAVVAAMIVPNVVGRPDEARATVAETDLRSIESALELYRLDNRVYPTTAQGLAALVERPSAPPVPETFPAEGYLDTMPEDPWGNAYVYRSPGQSGAFDLISLGADGRPGGDAVNADIGRGARQEAGG
ncbi:type II secretion system major pseudopilin GspG [Roseivivax sp. THAF30]|uniref:type II secretion system major pseudopilin GspG n=1 Tax=Roseivivax sp. THAF30 TaxID=2587852 RepID=UPI0012688BE4|nr:type II secretion system major pseudopilin GspG [Roseivivax sp. THAF30]